MRFIESERVFTFGWLTKKPKLSIIFLSSPEYYATEVINNLKKALAVLAALTMLFSFTACSSNQQNYVDGTYHVEFSEFDSTGYKDFIDVVIEGGKIVKFTANAIDAKGNLKSDSAEYRKKMEPVVGNYPQKFYQDFANQFIDKSSAESIDIVAGATMSSKRLIQLASAMEAAALTGKETNIVVDSPVAAASKSK